MNLTDARRPDSRPPVKITGSWLRDLLPPLRDKNFWIGFILVISLALLHDIDDRLGFLPYLGSFYFLSIALFFIPLIFVAWHYRPAAPVATGFWIVVLTIPDWSYWHHTWDERLSVLLFLLLMTILAAFISRGIQREKAACEKALQSEAASKASELKYWNLFESSPVPVIIFSPDGIVQETNPAADYLFGNKTGLKERNSLSDLIGRENAALLQTHDKAKQNKFFSFQRGDGTNAYLKPTLSDQSWGSQGVIQVILKDVTEEHNRQMHLKAYAAAITGAREEERRRIARALHDDSIQPLILLCRRLDNSVRLGAASGPALTQELAGARKTVEDLVSQLREFITSLRPPALDDFGIVTVVRSLVREYRKHSSAEIELNITGDYQRMPPQVELGIFRIAQEALSNAVRHSMGSKLNVNLNFLAEEVRLEVIDNGTGFSMPPAAHLINLGHFGIIGMQERADMFGGKIFIESNIGTGTKVTAVMKLLERGHE